MKIFSCKTFTGVWPVGTAALTKADTPEIAAEQLNAVLRELGLPGDAKPEDMIEFPQAAETTRILCDGNY